MSRKTYTWTQWLKYVARHILADDKLAALSGLPVVDVAEKLGVSRQSVEKLINADVLDTVEITTKSGKLAFRIVTDASLERYLENRVPMSQGRHRLPEQLNLGC